MLGLKESQLRILTSAPVASGILLISAEITQLHIIFVVCLAVRWYSPSRSKLRHFEHFFLGYAVKNFMNTI